MPKVYNVKRGDAPAGAVRVDRSSKWGNPFVMRDQSHTERNRVCDEFEALVARKPSMVAAIKAELRGKDLVCWCAPKRCHADTLLRIANEP